MLILFFAQVDHFEGIHAMPDEVEKVDGAPNFRQVHISDFLPFAIYLYVRHFKFISNRRCVHFNSDIYSAANFSCFAQIFMFLFFA